MWKRKEKKEETRKIQKKKIDFEGYPYIKDIVHFNTQYCSISPYGDKTLLKTPDSVIKSTLFSRSNRFLSEEFLLNYRSDNSDMGFRTGLASFFQPSATMTEVNRDYDELLDEAILLPSPVKIKTSLEMAVLMRRSARNFEKYEMPLKDLGTLLFYAQGISATGKINGILGGPDKLAFRNAPSGGGLYPMRIYCALHNIDSLEDGIYVYMPYSHSIRKVNEYDIKNIDEFAEFSNVTKENVSVVFIYEYNMLENARKYGDNGCAYAFIEAGEISQNVQLCATALGYGSCDIGGYQKYNTEEMIKSDHMSTHVIHMQIIGKEGGKDE